MNSKLKNLSNLRWGAATGIIAVFIYLNYYGTYTLWTFGYVALGVYILSNVLLQLFANTPKFTNNELIIFIITLFDLAFLTLLLFYNGGAHNPFTILFIAICSVAAINVTNKTFLLNIILFCLGSLWVIYNFDNVSPSTHHHLDTDYILHLRGMWIANSLAIITITFWIYYLRSQTELIANKHRELQRVLQNVERVESMGRVLAATAHHLNTPLATLQLGINELSDKLRPLSDIERDEWLNDLQLAIKRISDILLNVKVKSRDELRDNTAPKLDFVKCIESLALRWAEARNVSVSFNSKTTNIFISNHILADIIPSIEAILENAYEARYLTNELQIDIDVNDFDKFISVSIKDNGLGMSREILNRATEPLFTNKKSGTGLGLYITHQLVDRLGGSLQINSTPKIGTEVILSFNRRLIV